MATFLQLCQRVAQESGTVSGTQPSTVVGQTGRLGSIVQWVAAAYSDIQNHRKTWLWMQGEFEASLTIAKQRYAGSDFALTRVAEFDRGLFLYDASKGVSDEGPLTYMQWRDFFNNCLTGANRAISGKPVYTSFDPSGSIALWPTPDKAYKLHGQYRDTPQTLAADADVPEMPVRFHDIIIWKALIKLSQFDEAMTQYPLWNVEYRRLLSELEHDQLPRLTIGQERFA